MFSLWTPRKPEPEIYTTPIVPCPAGSFKYQFDGGQSSQSEGGIETVARRKQATQHALERA